MQFIGLAWLLTKFIHAGNIIFNRVASWTGALYYYKKAQKTGKKTYYLLAALIYIVSWIFLILCSSKVWVWLLG